MPAAADPPRAADPPEAPRPETSADARLRGGFSLREYDARVWDMAKHQLHPAAIYVVATVAGATRLLGHPRLDDAGVAWLVEGGLFACVFLGAWACFWSTLLRVAGLASRTVTILVPVAAASALAIWTAFPAPAAMSARTLGAAAALLGVPGPVAFAVTWRTWRRHRRAHEHLLPEADR